MADGYYCNNFHDHHINLSLKRPCPKRELNLRDSWRKISIGRRLEKRRSWSAGLCWLSVLVPGSARFTLTGSQPVASTLPTQYSNQMTFTSALIDLSTKSRRVENDVYRSFEPITIMRGNDIPSSLDSPDFSTLPSSMVSDIASISAAPKDWMGRSVLSDIRDKTWNVEYFARAPYTNPAIYYRCLWLTKRLASANIVTHTLRDPLERGR